MVTRAIEADGVTYVYRGTAGNALDGVSLSIGAGDAVAIAGESGSGKTTLARLIAGLDRPAGGTIRVAGVDTRTVRPGALARRVGLVFQNPNHQLFARTVGEELALGPLAAGARAGDAADRAREVARRMRIDALVDVHPLRATYADRRRVAIAAVLAMQPDILVLDEPTGGQDDDATALIADAVRAERDRGATVVVITHDLRFAGTVADRLVVLRGGRIAADGPIRTAVADHALLRGAGLEPPRVSQLAAALGLAGGDDAPLTADEVVRLALARGGGGR